MAERAVIDFQGGIIITVEEQGRHHQRNEYYDLRDISPSTQIVNIYEKVTLNNRQSLKNKIHTSRHTV